MINKYKLTMLNLFKLELESYQGNLYLYEVYKTSIYRNNKQKFTYTKELNRIEINIERINKFIKKLPNNEKYFICDVYVDKELSTEQIMKKYKLNRIQYYKLIDKIISEFICGNESDSC